MELIISPTEGMYKVRHFLRWMPRAPLLTAHFIYCLERVLMLERGALGLLEYFADVHKPSVGDSVVLRVIATRM